jgi:hypothetical protein
MLRLIRAHRIIRIGWAQRRKGHLAPGCGVYRLVP